MWGRWPRAGSRADGGSGADTDGVVGVVTLGFEGARTGESGVGGVKPRGGGGARRKTGGRCGQEVIFLGEGGTEGNRRGGGQVRLVGEKRGGGELGLKGNRGRRGARWSGEPRGRGNACGSWEERGSGGKRGWLG